jgi:hypothetical protein
MNTTVGGCAEGCCARRGIATRNKKANHRQNTREDFSVAVTPIIVVKSNLPRNLPEAISLLDGFHIWICGEAGWKAPGIKPGFK